MKKGDKMSKKLLIIPVVFLCICLALALCACAGLDSVDQTGTPEETNVVKVPEIMPTKAGIVAARANAVADLQQNYDFKVNLAGIVGVSFFNGTANANYAGSYRYNQNTGDLQFKRITSGVLLYDSIEYIYNVGSSKIKLVANEDNTVKRITIVPQEDEGINLINMPFVSIVNGLKDTNINTVEKSSSSEYKYVAKISLSSGNDKIQTLIDVLGKLGTTVEIGDLSFSNLVSGVDFYFNLGKDNKLNDFSLSAEVSFPVEGVPVKLLLTYSQQAKNSKIEIPSVDGLITDTASINSEMDTINAAVQTLKSSAAYSVELEARNEFDPGWNITASVDKFYASFYKKTNEERIDFNNSFEYKAHSEGDGVEKYKYTVANIQDGTVYQVSRKGTNVIVEAPGVTVDTEFDYLLSTAMVSSNDVDCIKKEINGDGDTTIYNIYINKTATYSVQNNILDKINSNEAEGVLDVCNYFDSQKNSIEQSLIIVELKDGLIVSINVETKIKYNPTEGEHVEKNILLTDTICIKVNEKLSEAEKYTAPKTTNTPITGLNNAKYYIG